jgi:hypothetical protein
MDPNMYMANEDDDYRVSLRDSAMDLLELMAEVRLSVVILI